MHFDTHSEAPRYFLELSALNITQRNSHSYDVLRNNVKYCIVLNIQLLSISYVQAEGLKGKLIRVLFLVKDA